MDDKQQYPDKTVTQLIEEHEAKYFLASIINSLQDSVVTINFAGIITSWNKGAEHLYGYPAEEAIGKSLNMVILPEDFKGLLESIARIRNGEQVNMYHTMRIHKDGQHLELEVTLSPVKNRDGEVIGLSTLTRNVSDLYKYQQASEQSERKLRAIIEAPVDFGIIMLDENGTIVDWNKGAELLFGYGKEDVLGKHTRIIFSEEDRYGEIPEKELRIASEEGRSLDERWHIHKDGSRFFMSGVMTPIRDSSISGYVKVARDVTDRKLAEEALLRSEQRKNLVIKSAEIGEWEWQLSTSQVRISEQVAVLLGLPVSVRSLLPHELMAQVYPGDQNLIREQITASSNGLHVLQAECRIIRADNQQIRWVNLYARVVSETREQPSKMIGVLYDITSRKLLEKQKDDFISVASHELRTPVTTIKAYAELLTSNLQGSSGQGMNIKLLDKLNGQVDRLTKLIRNLLDSTQISEGRMKLKLQTVDLNALISEQYESLQQITSHHQLTLKPGTIPLLQADRERVSQVIINFVTNAAKYSPAASEIIVCTEDEGDKIRVSVQDRGMGIPGDEQRLIFERYYRTKHSPEEAGFGLGLFICSEIIQQHGGDIGVTSSPGEGSTFYFTLPCG